ncbi:MAG: plasmid stabilization protein [Desulfovibrio sp.]|nr:plasmid stabilization protein [Desulfovibrio sp.]MBI4960501.1 plasmid stabilization protein [Desulfovibrio sp.]
MAGMKVELLEDELLGALRQRASSNGRSLQAEIRDILRREVLPDREPALGKLAEKRKKLASRAFPEGDTA